MTAQEITVISRKYDLSIRRTWKCDLVGRSGPLIELIGAFAEEVEHPDLGLIKKGTLSHEYFWLDRWFNVFRFQEPGHTLRNFYCNLNMPPQFDGETLDYVDLEIDLLLWPDGRVITLDEDEFAENAVKYEYSIIVIQNVDSALIELRALISARQFPFNTV
jgi:protein associated with RNAse G/E